MWKVRSRHLLVISVLGNQILQVSTACRKINFTIFSNQECGFNLLRHQPYLPDLAPSDYNLLPQTKKELSNRHFDGDDNITDAVDHFVEVQDAIFYKEGIHMLHYL